MTEQANTFLIYGANGYTGELITRYAVERGLKPLLGGRNSIAIEELAKKHHLDYRVFSLDETSRLDAALAEVDMVLHCAGPFSITSRAMVEACLRNRKHYTDITGEISVFESMAALDDKAKASEVMVMPGVGFDVVPSDCLARHLKDRLPTATTVEPAPQPADEAAAPPPCRPPPRGAPTVSIWTPSGEHEVPRDRPGPSPAGGPTGAGAPDDDWRERLMAGELQPEDLTPEQQAEVEAAVAEMAEAQRQLLATPIEQYVTQHIIGFRELAILHLQQADPDFGAAQIAIDAIAGIIEAVGPRLGQLEEPLRQDVTQLQMAFVQRKGDIEAGGSPS